MADFAVRWVPIADIKPHPNNPRHHAQEQTQELAVSLEEDGWLSNVILSADGYCLHGHGIIGAAKSRGETQVPVLDYPHEHDDPRSLKVLVKMNTLGLPRPGDPKTPQDDADDLSQLLLALQGSDVGLAGTSFDDDSLAALLEEVAAQRAPTGFVPEEDPGPGEPPAEPVTRLGDVWVMGAHRLVCGDATQEHVWATLGGERAGRVAFWSPPYALRKSSALRSAGAKSQSESVYVNPDSAEGWREMIDGMTAMAYAFAEVAVVNVQPLAGNKRDLLRWVADNAGRLCDVVTWDKGHAAPQMAAGVLASRYEWLVILAKENASRAVPLASWCGTLQSVYDAPPQRDNEFAEIHGATFPVHLPLFVLKDLCDKSSAVVDCCMGTGTTLIAAEQSGRVGYGIELEPRYCDVTVTRWQRMTNKQAILESTGQTFAALQAQKARP